MDIVLNSYSLALISSSIAAMTLAIWVFTRVGEAAKWFSACMAAISIWGLAYGVGITQPDLKRMLFWVNVEYIGITLVPTIWFVFVLKFTGRDCKLNALYYSLMFGFAIISMLMVWTNPLHNLHYAEYELVFSNPFYTLKTKAGPWYIIHTLFFYSLILGGLWVLIRSIRSTSGVFRLQSMIIIGGTIVPWIANILVVTGYDVFKGLDFTPFAFLITSLIIGVGFLRFGLFDILPMARDKVINEMHEGWLVIDYRRRVIDLNPEMELILQKRRSDLMGEYFEGFGKPEIDDQLTDFENDKTVDVEVLQDGEIKDFEVTCKTMGSGNGAATGRLFIFRDITQYKVDQRLLNEQAEELIDLNEVKNKLLSVISHDVRAPLSMLTKVIEMHGDNTISDQDVKDLLPKLGENLNQVSGFLENLLIWSKSQFDGEKVLPMSFDMAEEVDKKIRLLTEAIEAKDISIELINQSEDSLAFADINMIRVVLRNLLSNAIKFSKVGGNITFTVKAKGNLMEVALADDGVGIAQENLDKLFSKETFTTHGTNMEQGTGLGLMLAKEFIQKNRGRIWVESTLGKGSTFYFSVPLAPESVEVS